MLTLPVPLASTPVSGTAGEPAKSPGGLPTPTGPPQSVLPPGISWLAAIDGGVSGEIVAMFNRTCWRVHRVAVTRENGRPVLDIKKNLAFLDAIAERAGGRQRLFVVYERSRQNTMFGVKNSFANGRNEEFWRVLLTLGEFQFASVDPKTWQAYCFKGIAEGKPKPRALKFVQRNCPDLGWLESHTKAERLGIVDAMCIALWALGQRQPGPP
jgi:hypothetical protein